MRAPFISDVTNAVKQGTKMAPMAAALARKAVPEVPGTAIRLLSDDRALTVARRATGRAGLRYAVRNRKVLVVGTDLAAERLRDAGADVRVVADADAEDFAAGAPDVLVLCGRPVTAGDSLDLDAAEAAIEANYYTAVRACLAALPAMRERGSGQIIAATASAPDASAVDRAAVEAASAFLRIVSAEVAGDGVTVTQVKLPSDPDAAAARITEAIALRPRVAPVRLPV